MRNASLVGSSEYVARNAADVATADVYVFNWSVVIGHRRQSDTLAQLRQKRKLGDFLTRRGQCSDPRHLLYYDPHSLLAV